ncbi:hypothetical protein [Candidatus Methanoperedens nitratireducens]|uniref:hypothetical protein n=1 Tax=Candidatus Methanoperedens nitratireducens TaxID=1392998 RepID=UPI0015CD0BE3|nr:hypothetical protein [Candidatus Methanoperedens nitroreducens]
MKNTHGFPLLVKLGLVGIGSRKTALAYFWLSILLSFITFFVGLTNGKYLLGLFFLLAAWWYWFCIKWIDKNSKWEG